MAVHLIKLCVGVETISELAARQARLLREMESNRSKPELMHITRHRPKRAEELLDGGSLYWVIKGRIAVRQKLLALRPVTREGMSCCGLVYDKELVTVRPYPSRPFQGWRYLNPAYAPPDMAIRGDGQDPYRKLERELIAAGLI